MQLHRNEGLSILKWTDGGYTVNNGFQHFLTNQLHSAYKLDSIHKFISHRPWSEGKSPSLAPFTENCSNM